MLVTEPHFRCSIHACGDGFSSFSSRHLLWHCWITFNFGLIFHLNMSSQALRSAFAISILNFSLKTATFCVWQCLLHFCFQLYCCGWRSWRPGSLSHSLIWPNSFFMLYTILWIFFCHYISDENELTSRGVISFDQFLYFRYNFFFFSFKYFNVPHHCHEML